MNGSQGIPPIEEGAAFLGALEPHVRRLVASVTFMNMDCTWEGRQAAEFAALIEAMADWIDGPGRSRMFGLLHEIEATSGIGWQDERRELQSACSADYGGNLEAILDGLHFAAVQGNSARFTGKNVTLLKAIVDDLVRRSFVVIPRTISGLEDILGTARSRQTPAPR